LKELFVCDVTMTTSRPIAALVKRTAELNINHILRSGLEKLSIFITINDCSIIKFSKPHLWLDLGYGTASEDRCFSNDAFLIIAHWTLSLKRDG